MSDSPPDPIPGTLTAQDQQYLQLLSIGHYIVGAISALYGCFPVIHLAIGIWMLVSPQAHKTEEPFIPVVVGGLFTAFASALILAGWSLAVALVVAGRSLARRKRYTFCLVVAVVVAAMCMPFGTVLGVFTLIVLSRPTVKAAFV